MYFIKNKYYFLIILFYFTLGSCDVHNKSNCNTNFFNYTSDQADQLNSIINLQKNKKDIQKKSYCGYDIKINFWKSYPLSNNSIPIYILDGFLFMKHNIIYCMILHNGIYKFKLFDFNLQKGEMELIKYFNIYKNVHNNHIFIDSVKCTLILDDKFLNNNQDSIYKFRFKDLGYFYPHSDLVFFVSRKYGIYGMYCSDVSIINGERKEYMLTYIGQIFKNRLDKKHVYFQEHFSIE